MVSDLQMSIYLRSNPDFLSELPEVLKQFALKKYVGEGTRRETTPLSSKPRERKNG